MCGKKCDENDWRKLILKMVCKKGFINEILLTKHRSRAPTGDILPKTHPSEHCTYAVNALHILTTVRSRDKVHLGKCMKIHANPINTYAHWKLDYVIHGKPVKYCVSNALSVKPKIEVLFNWHLFCVSKNLTQPIHIGIVARGVKKYSNFFQRLNRKFVWNDLLNQVAVIDVVEL